MSAVPGWYPDPGGQSGQYRYWDGQTWSAVTTANPQAPPPTPGLGAPRGGGSQQPGSAPYSVPAKKKSGAGWIIGLVALVVAVAVAGVFIVRGLGSSGGDDPTDPQNNPSAAVCPDSEQQSESPAPQSGDRVHSGKLSYPRLDPPFSAPVWDSRVPFGRDVQSQNATVEEGGNGAPSWVAGVLIARLLAGDGFYGPEQGAAVVVDCITGKFYGDSEVDREDSLNEATTIDGHDAWIIESHLTFDVPGVKTKGEKLIVVVVDIGGGEGGLFYASIPDTSPQHEEPARDALKGLTVDE